MIVKTGQAVVAEFPTSAPTTGAAANADSLPTGTLYVDGTANAAAVTVTNQATGLYKASVTLPALTAGQMVAIVISATIGGIACVGKVWEAVSDTARISESDDAVLTLLGAPAGASHAADLDAILTSVGLRLLTSGYTAPPSAATVRDAVLSADPDDYDPGSVAAAIAAAGGAADPMLNTPAGYASGTLGRLIGALAAGRVTVRQNVTPEGNIPEIVSGRDYLAEDGQSIDWSDDDEVWPDLTGATVTWCGTAADDSTEEFPMTVVTPTGLKEVRLELTHEQSAALVDTYRGDWRFSVWAVLATSGNKHELVRGTTVTKTIPGPPA